MWIEVTVEYGRLALHTEYYRPQPGRWQCWQPTPTGGRKREEDPALDLTEFRQLGGRRICREGWVKSVMTDIAGHAGSLDEGRIVQLLGSKDLPFQGKALRSG